MKILRFLPLLLLTVVVACSEDAPTAPASFDVEPSASIESSPVGALSVLSRNLYIGTNTSLVIAAVATPDPNDDVPALLAAIDELQRTSFPDRAAALAGEIARQKPHIVGLQEVSIIDIDLRPLGLPIDFDVDYLQILQARLAALGQSNYVVAASVVGITATLPGVSVIDRDVILVDADRVSWDPASVVETTFNANLGVVAPGVNLRRGWVGLEATVDGATFKVVNTHLESGANPALTPLRAAQAMEIVQALGAGRAVVLGDLNEGPGSPMHAVLTGAGFTDVWLALRPGAKGLTCCHVDDLSNSVANEEFDERIDYVMTRGFGHGNGKLIGQVALLGTTPGERVAGPQYPVWPSDHAGVLANLWTPPAP